jgi:hypothetical protein
MKLPRDLSGLDLAKTLRRLGYVSNSNSTALSIDEKKLATSRWSAARLIDDDTVMH